MNSGPNPPLVQAANQVGLDPTDATVIRAGENQIYRLPGQVIVRIAPPGQEKAARREIFLARWMNNNGVRAVEPLDIPQPVITDGGPVTFWHELGPHEHGSPRQIASAIKKLHALPIPDELANDQIAPFVRLQERIDSATWLAEDDSAWLTDRLRDLETQWDRQPAGMPESVVHGDAWAGNVVDVEGVGVTMLDLERCSVGPPEWDLTSVACRFTSYSTLSESDYAAYCDEYGFDVTTWGGFSLLRDIRELRVTCYAVYVATENSEGRHLAQQRVDCLRGKRGLRPWRWPPII